MKELSLHILDIATNSIDAGASLIIIQVEKNTKKNYVKITLEDNGSGINKNKLNKITNPFYTTRTTRNVGLGLPLFKSAAERCDGYLEINSNEGKGTKVEALFKNDHIDRAPLGKIEESIIVLLNYDKKFDLIYKYKVNDNKFVFDTREIKKRIPDLSINNPKILIWIKEYIKENIKNIDKYEI